MVYCMCILVKKNSNDRRLRNQVTLPPNFRQAWGYPHIRGQNIRFVPIFFAVNISFYVLDISRFKIKMVLVRCGGGGGVHGGWL